MPMLRCANPLDLETLLGLSASKTRPSLLVRGQGAVERHEYYRQLYQNLFQTGLPHPEFDILVMKSQETPAAYVTILKSQPEGMSGLTQSVIFDYFAPDDAILAELVTGARGWAEQNYRTSHLTVEVHPGQKLEAEAFTALGFHPETHRIAVRTAPWSATPDYPYEVRLARESDQMFLVYLNSVSLPFVLPASRQHDLDRISAQSMAVYAQLLRKNEAGNVVLILTEKRRQIGYLILKLGVDGQDPRSTPLAYVYDLAVEQAHWGRRGVLQIMRTGSDLLFQRSIPLLIGDISASNPRALKTAQRNLGFSVEWTRYGVPLKR